MPSEATSENHATPKKSPSTGEATDLDNTRNTRENEITELTDRVTATKTSATERAAQAEQRRVRLVRTQIAYKEGIPVHLLRGTTTPEIEKYATALQNWKG